MSKCCLDDINLFLKDGRSQSSLFRAEPQLIASDSVRSGNFILVNFKSRMQDSFFPPYVKYCIITGNSNFPAPQRLAVYLD